MDYIFLSQTRQLYCLYSSTMYSLYVERGGYSLDVRVRNSFMFVTRLPEFTSYSLLLLALLLLRSSICGHTMGFCGAHFRSDNNIGLWYMAHMVQSTCTSDSTSGQFCRWQNWKTDSDVGRSTLTTIRTKHVFFIFPWKTKTLNGGSMLYMGYISMAMLPGMSLDSRLISYFV